MNIVNARFLTQRVTGVQRYAIELSKKIQESGYKIQFLAPPKILNKKLAKQLNTKVIGKTSGYFWEQVELPRYLNSIDNPLLINLCNTAPLKYNNSIVTIHDLAFYEHPEWFSTRFRSVYRFLIPRIARRAKYVLTVSNYSKEKIANHLNINEEKIKVVYNGVKPVDYELNTKKNKPYILFVGSMDYRKNLNGVISAMQYLDQNIQLKIVGGISSTFKKLELAKNENVEYLGYVSDDQLSELYLSARVFVFPSFYEGFGIPPLEAQSLGVPTVVSDIEVFREVFQDSVEYCNPFDPESIAKAIADVYKSEDRRNRLISLGKLNASRFSWELSAKQLLELINLGQINASNSNAK